MNDQLLHKFNEIEKHHWWWEGRRELIKQLLNGKKPKRILDVGCGTGETMTYLKGLYPGAKIYGVDTSRVALKYSRDRGHKYVYKSNAKKLPFKNNYFDTVLFLDVLEHIKNDEKAVSEARRVLKPGGLVLITSPGLSFIWSDHDTGQGHVRRYTRREIRRIASNLKMKMKFISYFNFFLSPPIIAIRLLSRLSAFKKFATYDRGVNYDIANDSVVNTILKYIFVKEINALKVLRYPIGISIVAKLEK